MPARCHRAGTGGPRARRRPRHGPGAHPSSNEDRWRTLRACGAQAVRGVPRRVRGTGRVVVGTAKAEPHEIACLDRDSSENGVDRCSPEQALHGRLQSKDLLEGLGQAALVSPYGCLQGGASAQRVHSELVIHLLVVSLPAVSNCEVITSISASLVPSPSEPQATTRSVRRSSRERSGDRRSGLRSSSRTRGVRTVILEFRLGEVAVPDCNKEELGPPLELGHHLVWDSEHASDGDEGDRGGVLAHQLTSAVARERVDQVVCQGPQTWLQRRDSGWAR